MKLLKIHCTDNEYETLNKLAQKSFMTVEEYVKSKLFGNAKDINKLVDQALEKINTLESGTKFALPQLFGLEWNNLTKGVRISLGKKVYAKCKSPDAVFKDIGKDSSNLQWYEKL